MRIRGQRTCASCGTEWSYFATGDVHCPSCGSVRSVGSGERVHHTDDPVELDLAPVRERVAEGELREAAAEAVDRSRTYLAKRGFLAAGELAPLDPRYVSVSRLHRVGGELGRSLRTDGAGERYLTDLLECIRTGEELPPDAVPESVRGAHGLGTADAVAAYERDLRTVIEDRGDDVAQRLSGRIRTHRKRVEALDGAVDPEVVDQLVAATRALGAAVGSPADLAAVEQTLQKLP